MSVSRYADIIVARRTAKELAQQLGFETDCQEQIALVVSELTSNLIKYAGRGLINLKAISEAGRTGILISSHDRGPGFDSGKALTDGYSSSGTLGIGLGAVRRMVDVLEIDSRQNGQSGTDIVCKKWLSSPPATFKHQACPLAVGIVSQPKPDFDINGDAYLVKPDHQGNCLIAVIDGVGHGLPANKSAQAALHYIESHSMQAMAEIFRGVESACQPSSGVVMALAHFDIAHSTLTFASIGNIEAKIVGSNEKSSLLIRRGILGRQAPAPIVSHHRWMAGLGLVMHSDGVSSRWNWQEFAHLAEKPAQFIAEQMHRKLHKDSDDATLIFVK